MTRRINGDYASQLSELVAAKLGLHFSRERHDELQRATAQAARELGLDYPRWPLAVPPNQDQLNVLASHLTVGETYFFRDADAMKALVGTVLPQLIASSRNRSTRRLRIWSAGCCTGEEPYSIAILLHQALPDLPQWQISITATDINPQFLRKAQAGIYGEWSFRGVARAVRDRYFSATEDGRFAIAPHIRSMVTFRHFNLADESDLTRSDTHAMDLILCRNVLMYFAEPWIRKAASHFRRALADGGWLAVAPCEASQSVFREFVTVNLPGAIFYRKQAEQRDWKPEPRDISTGGGSPWRTHAVTSDRVQPDKTPSSTLDTGAWAVLARARADEGQLPEALELCERWIGADKLNAEAHYLRAVILTEQDDAVQARSSLLRAIYLQPDFVLAHFALGNLARAGGRHSEAGRHFGNARELLSRHQPGDVLPESDGLTARELALSLGGDDHE